MTNKNIPQTEDHAFGTRAEVLTLCFDRLDEKLVCFDRARRKKNIFRPCSTEKIVLGRARPKRDMF